VRERYSADSIGLFRGTAAFHNSTAFGIHGHFLQALGTSSLFTTLSIDQGSRCAGWEAGTQDSIT
jgi:hypothetical protein